MESKKFRPLNDVFEEGDRRFPKIDMGTWFYKNCKTQRRRGAKICQVCPFREGIEEQEVE